MKIIRFFFAGLSVLMIVSCGNGEHDVWFWISGSNTINQSGIYGTKGVAAPSNIPGARHHSVSWTDSHDNLWLFGGYGYDSSAVVDGPLNDLWKFDGINWTWVSGSDAAYQFGNYGTKGTVAAGNVPGARMRSVSWIDSNDNFWLFGGIGYDGGGTRGGLNDLWKFDGTNWTWVSGSDSVDQAGVYGAKGVAASGNVPGGRSGAIAWIDSSGNLWLFGGIGFDGGGTISHLNDLWKFDGTNWTWVSGGDTVDQAGVYGKKGVTAPSHFPGARESSIAWIDSHDRLWLFGGFGYYATGSLGYLNDLWTFDGTYWTWVSGSDLAAQAGTYGTQGLASPDNVPGARLESISWADSNDSLWLFGGVGDDHDGRNGALNDLWRYSP